MRDGLKPSQRRLLVAVDDLNLGPTSATSKCTGSPRRERCQQPAHPHGEAAIYPTLVRLAQDWAMRHQADSPAGQFRLRPGPTPPRRCAIPRARLSAIAAEMLEEFLERDTAASCIDDYDGEYREPLVLPSKFPNLLVNG